ncbi:MAG: glycosyltransferase family 4 protein [Acidobacteriota bacterium]
MRVLYLTMNPNRASTTVPTEGWFRLLPARGLEPVLASTELGAFHAWTVAQGIPAFQVAMPVPAVFSVRTLVPALWQLRKLVKRYRIQLIHSNEQDLYAVAQYLGKVCRLPVVVSVHFTMDRGFSEWAFAGSRNPARIFFVSPGSRDACRPGVGGVIPESKWRVLPNGLDLEHFVPDQPRRDRFRQAHGLAAGPAIGVACALRPRKQLEHLFDAASRVDVPNLRIVVAGGPVAGDEAYSAQLLANARAQLGDRLVVLGHLDELRGFYNAMDIFVNTSQEEACSISVLESLACGCPVLGYASKSVDGQILPDGGEIVEQDNIDALAVALGHWLGSPERLTARRVGARKMAEDHFDIRALSSQLWREYEDVLAGR